jgi:hypothetical protein
MEYSPHAMPREREEERMSAHSQIAFSKLQSPVLKNSESIVEQRLKWKYDTNENISELPKIEMHSQGRSAQTDPALAKEEGSKSEG